MRHQQGRLRRRGEAESKTNGLVGLYESNKRRLV
jgi:hypothetical protein